jgi:hypothetical protein
MSLIGELENSIHIV